MRWFFIKEIILGSLKIQVPGQIVTNSAERSNQQLTFSLKLETKGSNLWKQHLKQFGVTNDLIG